MEQEQKAEARRTAELLKAFAYLALAVYFVNAIFEFITGIRYDFSFGGFLNASWYFLKNIFVMGVFYVALLAASNVLTLLLAIHENSKKDQNTSV